MIMASLYFLIQQMKWIQLLAFGKMLNLDDSLQWMQYVFCCFDHLARVLLFSTPEVSISVNAFFHDVFPKFLILTISSLKGLSSGITNDAVLAFGVLIFSMVNSSRGWFVSCRWSRELALFGISGNF